MLTPLGLFRALGTIRPGGLPGRMYFAAAHYCGYNNTMGITYDPSKNAANIERRDLPFDLVADLDWATAVIVEDMRNDYGERRYRVFGYIGDRLAPQRCPACHQLAKSQQPRGKAPWLNVENIHPLRSMTKTRNGQPGTLHAQGPHPRSCPNSSAPQPRPKCCARSGGVPFRPIPRHTSIFVLIPTSSPLSGPRAEAGKRA